MTTANETEELPQTAENPENKAIDPPFLFFSDKLYRAVAVESPSDKYGACLSTGMDGPYVCALSDAINLMTEPQLPSEDIISDYFGGLGRKNENESFIEWVSRSEELSPDEIRDGIYRAFQGMTGMRVFIAEAETKIIIQSWYPSERFDEFKGYCTNFSLPVRGSFPSNMSYRVVGVELPSPKDGAIIFESEVYEDYTSSFKKAIAILSYYAGFDFSKKIEKLFAEIAGQKNENENFIEWISRTTELSLDEINSKINDFFQTKEGKLFIQEAETEETISNWRSIYSVRISVKFDEIKGCVFDFCETLCDEKIRDICRNCLSDEG